MTILVYVIFFSILKIKLCNSCNLFNIETSAVTLKIKLLIAEFVPFKFLMYLSCNASAMRKKHHHNAKEISLALYDMGDPMRKKHHHSA